jgi:hypothetical protein
VHREAEAVINKDEKRERERWIVGSVDRETDETMDVDTRTLSFWIVLCATKP